MTRRLGPLWLDWWGIRDGFNCGVGERVRVSIRRLPPLFSERQGLVRVLRLGAWRLRVHWGDRC